MHYEPFEELRSTGKLPSPSGVGLRILVLTRSESCSLDELARTLQADPALTGRILKLSNSVLSGGIQPATNVRDAGVSLLGLSFLERFGSNLVLLRKSLDCFRI